MISRRKIRIKALQALYSGQVYDLQQKGINKDDLKKSYDASLDQTEDALLTILWIVYKLNKYAIKEYDDRKNKLLQTDENANPKLLKLSELESMKKLEEDPYFLKRAEKLAAVQDIEAGMIKTLFRKYEKLDTTQEFLDNENASKSDEDTLLLHLLQDVLIPDENFQDYMEAQFPLWSDDEAEVFTLLARIIELGMDNVQFKKIRCEQLDALGHTLIDTVTDKRDFYQTLIEPRLKNWDPKRIAKIDMLVLYMGMSEFLYLDTVPVNVTINEYIDIIKQYGAPQSKQFVNALLDGLKTDLENQNLIEKKGQEKL